MLFCESSDSRSHGIRANSQTRRLEHLPLNGGDKTISRESISFLLLRRILLSINRYTCLLFIAAMKMLICVANLMKKRKYKDIKFLTTKCQCDSWPISSPKSKAVNVSPLLVGKNYQPNPKSWKQICQFTQSIMITRSTLESF